MKLLGIVGLLVTAVVLGLLVWLAYGKKDDAQNAAPAESSSLGAPPPSDIAKNPGSAKEYTTRQICLADCAGDHRTCTGVAADPAAKDACDKSKSDCEARCP